MDNVHPAFAPLLRAITPGVYRGSAKELRESLGFKTRKIDTEEVIENHDCHLSAEDGCAVCDSILRENIPGYDEYYEEQENIATGN